MKKRNLLPILLSALPLCACQDRQASPFDGLPVHEMIASGVKAPVDIFRDEHGIPHIYGDSLTDVVYAQGYVMAQDRLVQMDLLRHFASGTVAELLGALQEDLIDSDISMRVHHLRPTAEQVWQQISASSTDEDKALVQALSRFAAGVNAYITELSAGNRTLPTVLNLIYNVQNTTPWTEVDSLVLARLQAFELSFDPGSELDRTQAEAMAAKVFKDAADPRKGLWADLFRVAPIADAYILPDAQSCGMAAGMTNPPRPLPAGKAPAAVSGWARVRKALFGIGLSRAINQARGSNNWVVGPALTGSGHAIVSNDTHLSLSNPPVFYLSHLVVRDQVNLMGVQFPGLPGVVLGMNDHLAWGATVTNADVTDVYHEDILDCGDGSLCVSWRDPAQPATQKKVPLKKRVEIIRIGRLGKIVDQRTVTLWDVPHHGPLLPHLSGHDVAAPRIGTPEISVRYTGYQPTHEVRAILTLDQAHSVDEGIAAIERDFSVGGQNWNMADTSGRIGWTTHVNLPRRPVGAQPWYVLPGDGTAEWAADGVPAAQQPRALDASCGMVVTANNDPLGSTRQGGSPPGLIYHGWNYDVGARADRITTLLRQGKATPERLSVEKMQAIQADHHAYLGQLLLPVLMDAAGKLTQEVATPGTYPDLSLVARSLDDPGKARLADALARLSGWQLTTASGLDNETTPAEVAESIATSIFHVWLNEFVSRTLGDELKAIDDAILPDTTPHPYGSFQHKLVIAAALHPEQLHVGRQGNGDSILFDDVSTAGRTETLREVAAGALVGALQLLSTQLGADAGQWQWGRMHRLTLNSPLPIDALNIPNAKDPNFPTGAPRHGDLYSVDVGDFGLRRDKPQLLADYTYRDGPAIRFVAELGTDGPRGFNVLPGGEIFDPDSPHYADQFTLWRHNQAFPLPFDPAAVAASAQIEESHGGTSRVRLIPDPGKAQ